MIDKSSKSIYDLTAKFLKVLNHPTRLAILDILRVDDACVCHMEAWLGQRQAYLSQQISVLREAGIITDRRDGWNIYYHVEDPAVFEVLDILRKTLKVEDQPLPPAMVENCPCPKCSGQRGGCGQNKS